ncbi:enoyl-CoA hydratase [Betaproteobacteria bacterium]|nr:enoyl-CoA hydratase [Betaproteobacteria bacterium]
MSEVSETLVQYRENGPVAVIELARPEKLNALTPSMLSALESIVAGLDASRDIRAVVLSARGKAFCVGADINVWSALEPLDMWREWVRNGHRIFDRLAHLRQPVVAAINGPALGGGLELAAAADIRVAEPGAVFGLPEASIATCPGWSGTQRLVRLIGPSQVKFMALTAQRIDAETAHRIGLVQKVVPAGAVLDEALALAECIADLAPVSAQLSKQLIDAAAGEGFAANMEGMAGALAATTLDAGEGLASFRERRKASYQGK